MELAAKDKEKLLLVKKNGQQSIKRKKNNQRFRVMTI